jgi:hypothetical protein
LPIAYCLLPIVYCLLSSYGYWLLAIAYWLLLPIGYCPATAIGYWLLSIGYALSIATIVQLRLLAIVYALAIVYCNYCPATFVPAALLFMPRAALALQCNSTARDWTGHVDR